MVFEVSPYFPSCSPTQSTFEVKHGVARPKGTQSLTSSFCPGQDQLVPVSSLMDVCVLFLFPFSSYFSSCFCCFFFLHLIFFFLVYALNSFLKNLISFFPNCLSLWYAQSVSLPVFLVAFWGTCCFSTSPTYTLALPGFCLGF